MKKIIKLAILPATLLILSACGGNTLSTISTTISTSIEEKITIEVADKEYDGNAIKPTVSSATGSNVKLEYKLAIDDDSKYTETAPKDLGEYTVRASVGSVSQTKNFKITYSEVSDFSKYNTNDSYKVVSTPKEFLDALYEARYTYTTNLSSVIESDGYVVRNNVRKNETNWVNAITKGLYLKEDDEYVKIPEDTPWDENDTKYTKTTTYYEDSPYSKVSSSQSLEKEGKIRVIEINSNLDLGYNKIKDLGAANIFENWDSKNRLAGSTDVYADPDLQESGISKIKVENTTNLLIYSKNGSKLTHCGFSVSSCKNVQFKNLEMDEIWMWEDTNTALSGTPSIKVGDYDSFGWAYFKVSFSEDILIDHCTFGKSFDGQIDYSNPYYSSIGTYQKAPFGGTGSNGLKVTFCDFNAGSDDQNGYLYKMMNKIEQEYQVYFSNKSGYTPSKKSCFYYFTLRDSGLSFDDVLYGIAIPQKKAFLWGDSGDSYNYNKYLTATLANCTIKNIEDRLPKVRGGMAYVYNVLVDNTEYYPYVDKLKAKQDTVQKANSKFKLGCVSQGILAGLDASVYLESVEYKGISSYLKNNDSAATDKQYPTVNGGYMIVNSILGNKVGSTNKESNTDPFKALNSSTTTLSIANFSFKENGVKTDKTVPPFTIDAYKIVENGQIVGTLENYFAEHPTGTITL